MALDITRCPICTDSFDVDETSAPRAPIAPSCCGNNICRACVLQWHAAKQSDSKNSIKNFPCPWCNRPKALHIEHLPTPNHGFLTTLKMLASMEAAASALSSSAVDSHQNLNENKPISTLLSESEEDGGGASALKRFSGAEEDAMTAACDEEGDVPDAAPQVVVADVSADVSAAAAAAAAAATAVAAAEVPSLLGHRSSQSGASTSRPQSKVPVNSSSEEDNTDVALRLLDEVYVNNLIETAAENAENELLVVAVVVPPISAEECEAYIGMSISKEFPLHGTFKGTFINYDADVCLWKLQYEDGDEEEVDWNELCALTAKEEGGEPAAVVETAAEVVPPAFEAPENNSSRDAKNPSVSVGVIGGEEIGQHVAREEEKHGEEKLTVEVVMGGVENAEAELRGVLCDLVSQVECRWQVVDEGTDPCSSFPFEGLCWVALRVPVNQNHHHRHHHHNASETGSTCTSLSFSCDGGGDDGGGDDGGGDDGGGDGEEAGGKYQQKKNHLQQQQLKVVQWPVWVLADHKALSTASNFQRSGSSSSSSSNSSSRVPPSSLGPPPLENAGGANRDCRAVCFAAPLSVNGCPTPPSSSFFSSSSSSWHTVDEKIKMRTVCCYGDGRFLQVPEATLQRMEPIFPALRTEGDELAAAAVSVEGAERGAKKSGEKGEESAFKLGSRVTALYRGGGIWYPGTIANVHVAARLGSLDAFGIHYDIRFDDGDFESRVAARFLRAAPLSPSSSWMYHAEGVEVGEEEVGVCLGKQLWDAPASQAALKGSVPGGGLWRQALAQAGARQVLFVAHMQQTRHTRQQQKCMIANPYQSHRHDFRHYGEFAAAVFQNLKHCAAAGEPVLLGNLALAEWTHLAAVAGETHCSSNRRGGRWRAETPHVLLTPGDVVAVKKKKKKKRNNENVFEWWWAAATVVRVKSGCGGDEKMEVEVEYEDGDDKDEGRTRETMTWPVEHDAHLLKSMEEMTGYDSDDFELLEGAGDAFVWRRQDAVEVSPPPTLPKRRRRQQQQQEEEGDDQEQEQEQGPQHGVKVTAKRTDGTTSQVKRKRQQQQQQQQKRHGVAPRLEIKDNGKQVQFEDSFRSEESEEKTKRWGEEEDSSAPVVVVDAKDISASQTRQAPPAADLIVKSALRTNNQKSIEGMLALSTSEEKDRAIQLKAAAAAAAAARAPTTDATHAVSCFSSSTSFSSSSVALEAASQPSAPALKKLAASIESRVFEVTRISGNSFVGTAYKNKFRQLCAALKADTDIHCKLVLGLLPPEKFVDAVVKGKVAAISDLSSSSNSNKIGTSIADSNSHTLALMSPQVVDERPRQQQRRELSSHQRKQRSGPEENVVGCCVAEVGRSHFLRVTLPSLSSLLSSAKTSSLSPPTSSSATTSSAAVPQAANAAANSIQNQTLARPEKETTATAPPAEMGPRKRDGSAVGVSKVHAPLSSVEHKITPKKKKVAPPPSLPPPTPKQRQKHRPQQTHGVQMATKRFDGVASQAKRKRPQQEQRYGSDNSSGFTSDSSSASSSSGDESESGGKKACGSKRPSASVLDRGEREEQEKQERRRRGDSRGAGSNSSRRRSSSSSMRSSMRPVDPAASFAALQLIQSMETMEFVSAAEKMKFILDSLSSSACLPTTTATSATTTTAITSPKCFRERKYPLSSQQLAAGKLLTTRESKGGSKQQQAVRRPNQESGNHGGGIRAGGHGVGGCGSSSNSASASSSSIRNVSRDIAVSGLVAPPPSPTSENEAEFPFHPLKKAAATVATVLVATALPSNSSTSLDLATANTAATAVLQRESNPPVSLQKLARKPLKPFSASTIVAVTKTKEGEGEGGAKQQQAARQHNQESGNHGGGDDGESIVLDISPTINNSSSTGTSGHATDANQRPHRDRSTAAAAPMPNRNSILPPGWQARYSHRRELWYFVNQSTGKSQWTHPAQQTADAGGEGGLALRGTRESHHRQRLQTEILL